MVRVLNRLRFEVFAYQKAVSRDQYPWTDLLKVKNKDGQYLAIELKGIPKETTKNQLLLFFEDYKITGLKFSSQ
jgi:hypothetical protein